ncbi:MAG: hypothetical protein IT567_07530, partial [Alphaproteobacteria bacterium]|nr:hypothetical protein [Alphaproteobacteria bacterium]
VGISVIFPQIIAARIKCGLKYLLQSVIKIWRKLFARIKKYFPERKINRLFENKVFLAAFYFALAGLAWSVVNTEQKEVNKALLTCSAVVLVIMGLVSLFPTTMKAIGNAIDYAMKAIGHGAVVLVGVGVFFWTISAIAGFIGAIPLSIIVGSLVIAFAILIKA